MASENNTDPTPVPIQLSGGSLGALEGGLIVTTRTNWRLVFWGWALIGAGWVLTSFKQLILSYLTDWLRTLTPWIKNLFD